MFLDRKKLPEDFKVGFTCSTFDLFHAGHIVMLQEAKTLCDYLIVGLLISVFLKKRLLQPLNKLNNLMRPYLEGEIILKFSLHQQNCDNRCKV